jgi:hypothetical protein
LAWIGSGGTARSRQHENTSLPNRRSRKPEEISGRNRARTHAVGHSTAVSIVHGHLMGSAFSTTPVVCLTLAKWETVSGLFGGYLNLKLQFISLEMIEGGRYVYFRLAIN